MPGLFSHRSIASRMNGNIGVNWRHKKWNADGTNVFRNAEKNRRIGFPLSVSRDKSRTSKRLKSMLQDLRSSLPPGTPGVGVFPVYPPHNLLGSGVVRQKTLPAQYRQGHILFLSSGLEIHFFSLQGAEHQHILSLVIPPQFIEEDVIFSQGSEDPIHAKAG
jgi:hypothetical protein